MNWLSRLADDPAYQRELRRLSELGRLMRLVWSTFMREIVRHPKSRP